VPIRHPKTPLSQDFKALTTDIANDQVDAAQAAWTKVKSALGNAGVPNLGDGGTSTAEVRAYHS
jgi:hypothetical protein